MKKFFIIMAMILGLVSLQSCKETNSGFLYNVTVTGEAAGDVVVTFPNGSFELDGDAALDFKYSNDTIALESLQLTDPLTSAELQIFAQEVEDQFTVELKDAAAEGTYHVLIQAYAKEPVTGMVIVVNKEFQYPPVNEEAEAEAAADSTVVE